MLGYNPDDAIYTVDDLLQYDNQDHVSSIKLHVHTSEDVEKERSSIAQLQQVQGTMKLHEKYFQMKEHEVYGTVKNESVGESRKVLLTTQRVTKNQRSTSAKLLNERTDDDSDQEEEDSDSCIFSFSFSASSDYCSIKLLHFGFK